MSSIELVTKVLSSAYHLLASLRPQEAILFPLAEAESHRIRGSTIWSESRGDSGPPCRIPRWILTGGVWP